MERHGNRFEKPPYSHLPMIQKKLSQTKFVGITANCSDF